MSLEESVPPGPQDALGTFSKSGIFFQKALSLIRGPVQASVYTQGPREWQHTGCVKGCKQESWVVII